MGGAWGPHVHDQTATPRVRQDADVKYEGVCERMCDPACVLTQWQCNGNVDKVHALVGRLFV